MKYAAQLVAYTTFFALVAVLSVRPELRLLDDDETIVSLSFSHAGQRVGECTRLSQEELMALPPNMRKADDCPRERHSLQVEFSVDDTVLYASTLVPSGLWRDGKSTVYQRIRITTGSHVLHIRMSDSGTPGQFNFAHTETVDMQPGRNLVVFFDPASQRFRFQ